MTGTKATCSVDPGPIAVELSLNLLLASQLHEGSAIFNSLSLLGKFSAETNKKAYFYRPRGYSIPLEEKAIVVLNLISSLSLWR